MTPGVTVPSNLRNLFSLSLSWLVLFALSACAEKPEPTSESTAATPVISAPTTLPGAAAANATPNAPSADALAAELTQVVRKYAAEKQRAPRDFQEIVSAGYLPSVPSAPAGKRFVIDKNLQVQVADQ